MIQWYQDRVVIFYKDIFSSEVDKEIIKHATHIKGVYSPILTNKDQINQIMADRQELYGNGEWNKARSGWIHKLAE